MKIQIENYRGWDIMFDTESETFYSHSDGYDHQKEKKSYSAAKKYIDDYIKENYAFKPFWIESKPGCFYKGKKKVVGIRKDGGLMCEDEDGKSGRLSSYDEKDYILLNPDNQPIWEAIAKVKIEIEALSYKRKGLENQITGTLLSDYKKDLLTN